VISDHEIDSSSAGWRSAALLATVIGAVGSIGFLRHAQQHPPPLIVAGFVVWVLAPFAMLAMANLASKRWPRTVGITLSVVTVLVTVASLLVYLDNNISHRASKPAFVFVAVPPASVLLSALALAIAATRVRKPGS
jgi:drug/metabolite transporter (DMT)-like permease